ncbi:MAG: pyrroline-5-carboxylate reductase [Clostridiales bacterium]|jgi:pyrroline-5-carboxylate reductase|nr:pyrroline-5-carboxylate reductase [Clostridiales bacterium]
MFKYKLGIIGAGNMSGAITGGILSGGKISPKDIAVSDIDADKLTVLAKNGFNTTSDNKYVVKNSENILFAVKPQSFSRIAEEIRGDLKAEAVISIMAGIDTTKLSEYFGKDKKICRIMPNTPCVIGKGICALTFVNYDEKDKPFIFDIFGNLGETAELSEDKFDAVTAVSGSGPAYVYTFLDAVIKGGVINGLTAQEAKLLAISVFKGAAELAGLSDKPLSELIKNVTSKGGTTEAALNVFESKGLSGVITEGVNAAANRSKELGR